MIFYESNYKKNFKQDAIIMQEFLSMIDTSDTCMIESMKNTIGFRIEQRRKELGLSQTELANRLGITPQSVQQWESDKTSPRGKRLDSLEALLMRSKQWLLFGSPEQPETEQPIFINIPILDVELAAGAGTHIDMESVTDWVPISQEWIQGNHLPKDHLVVVSVTGDSMSPRLQNGDMLLVNTADQRPVSGSVYAIAVENELRVKRLMKRMDGSWAISSDNKSNPAYQDEIISHHNFEQLRIIGRAVKVLMGDL